MRDRLIELIRQKKWGEGVADITYCSNKKCPFKKCERHPTKKSMACIRGKGYVSVADYSGTCRDYISYLVRRSDNNA